MRPRSTLLWRAGPLLLWGASCTSAELAGELATAPEPVPDADAANPEPSDAGISGADADVPTPEPALASFASSAPPARVVRLDQKGYEALLSALAPVSGLRPVFAARNPADRFSTRARSYHVDATELGLLEENARLVIESFTPRAGARCSLEAEDCQSMLLAEAIETLWRRPPESSELDAVLAVVSESEAGEARLAQRLLAALLHPETLFRSEAGTQVEGERRLLGHELASALAFTVTDGPPDPALRDRTHELATPSVYTTELRRLFAQAGHVEKVARFVREFFRYEEALEVGKDEGPEEVFPEGTAGAEDTRYRPAQLVADTDRLVAELVTERNQAFIENLLTTERVSVQPDTAIFYNLEPGTEGTRSAPSGQRSGLLTQPSWLVAFSEPDHTNPIRRGLFVQESLLCGEVPPLPIDMVPALEYQDRTMREALAAHAAPGTSCYGCHQFMDPMGLPFEQFDHLGRHRQTERGAPVVTSGALTWTSGDLPETGPVAGPRELTAALARSDQVVRCFAAHALEFWFGRKTRPGDARALEAAARVYRSSGGDFDALLESLLSSDIFLNRQVP